jgi:hypothetical protein
MSLPVGISVALAAAEGLLSTVIFRQRNIGGFVADVTIDERHDDQLTVTRNPVEQGAAITDHSFKEPAGLTVRVGYSNSSPQSLGDPNYVQDVYQNFLELQASRQPFDVITGKRAYANMLITRLVVMTDEKTENALMLTVEMREVILVTTQTVSVPSTGVMRAPGVTGATQLQGTVQTAPGTAANIGAGDAVLTTGAP